MRHLLLFQQNWRVLFGAFVLTLLFPLTCLFAQGTWEQKPDMPIFKNHHTAMASGSKIYLFGGGSDLGSCTDNVQEYDPVNGTYTAKASMPVALCGAATVEANGKIYLFGGYTTFANEVSNAALEYDVANNSWKTLADMPTARGYASAVSFPIQDKIWVIGGGSAFGAVGLKIVEIYNVATNTWSVGPAMPTGRGGLTTHSIVGNWGLLAFGGSVNTTMPAEEAVLLFEFFGGTWYDKKAAPTRRTLHCSAIFEGEDFLTGKVFLMGGMNPGEPVFSSVDMYDIYTDEWTSAVAPMHTARRAFGAAKVDKKIYVFGGNNESGVLKSVEMFDPGGLVSAFEPFTTSGTALLQNTPNPFRDETNISFSIPKSAQVDLSIFDSGGRKRITLVNQFMLPGIYTQHLNTGELEPGLYYYRLLQDGFKPEVRKMVVIR